MNKILFQLMILVIALALTTCRKEKNEAPPIDNTNNGTTISTSLSGILLDEGGKVIAGATIKAYGNTTTSDLNGIFFFDKINVNSSRCIIQITKLGFYNRSHAILASANNNYIKIVLLREPSPMNINSGAGGTISTTGGAKVQIYPNSLSKSDDYPYSGTVTLQVKQLTTDDANFGFMIPGGDLAGKDSTNNDVMLTSFGMLSVVITDYTGASLKLSPGTTATLTMPIAASQISSAPSTIPLWYFDEATSLWKEQGMATKIGSNYVGSVAHFSWWNFDNKSGVATIKGKVVDGKGIPLANLVVTVAGNRTIITDQKGEYSSWCPSNIPLTFVVLLQNNKSSLASQIESVAPLTRDQAYNVPDLVCGNPSKVKGSLNECEGGYANGIVCLKDKFGSIVNYLNVPDGTFQLFAPPNSSLTLSCYSALRTISKTFISPANDSTLNLGAVVLCDTLPIVLNSFVLDGGSHYHTQVTMIDNLYSKAIIYNEHFNIWLSIDDKIYLHINLDQKDTIPGTYHFSYASPQNCSAIYWDYGTVFSTDTVPGDFYVTLNKVPGFGGKVDGSFYGKMGGHNYMQHKDSIIIYNGHFNVMRQ